MTEKELRAKAEKSLQSPCPHCGKEHEIKSVPVMIIRGKVRHPNLDSEGNLICQKAHES